MSFRVCIALHSQQWFAGPVSLFCPVLVFDDSDNDLAGLVVRQVGGDAAGLLTCALAGLVPCQPKTAGRQASDTCILLMALEQQSSEQM